MNFFSYCCKPLSLWNLSEQPAGGTYSYLPGGPRICAFLLFPHWLFFHLSYLEDVAVPRLRRLPFDIQASLSGGLRVFIFHLRQEIP